MENKFPPPPKVGDTIEARGIVWTITKVRPFGTVDAVSSDGSRAVRITGLRFL